MPEVEQQQQTAAPPTSAGPAAASPKVAHPLLAIQRSGGNRAVGALLQTKLSVGRADDPAEREADRVAAEVMRTLHGGEAPPVRRSAAGHDELGGQDVSPDVQARIAGSSGRPMDGGTLSRMESAFGASFSGVRIHDGAEADTLSRSLQAEAFTTGSDVFFRKGNYDPGSSGGQELLAHELTHVVQQSGGVDRKVRRFVQVKEFAARTDEGTFTTKGPAQKEIEKLLTAYAKLGQEAKRPAGAKPHPSGVTVDILLKPAQYDQALALLKQMKQVAELWLDSNTVETTDEKTGKTTAKVKDSRAKRGAGMAWFVMACASEIERIDAQKAKEAEKGTAVPQDAVAVDQSGMAKLKEKYTGNLGTGLSTAGTILGKAVVNDGDSTEFNFDMKIPVQPGVFLGAILKFEASRNKGNTEVGVNAMFQAGASIGIANIGGALGGYFKASAKTAEGAMKLISYGFYRRCRESEVIPAALGNKIWGGDSGSAGKEKAEKWSLQVEETELQNDQSFVETGASGQAFAAVDGGPVGEGAVTATATTGTRHDKKSLDETKGGAGKKNEGPSDGGSWFAQAKTGRSVKAVELAAKCSFLSGTINGDVKFKLQYMDALDGKGVVYQGLQVKARASGRMNSAGFEGAIASLVGDVSKTVRLIVSKQFQDASGTDRALKLAVPGISLAKDSAEVTLQNMLNISVADALKTYSLQPMAEAAAPAANAASSAAGSAASAVGIDAGMSPGGGGGALSAAKLGSKVGIEVALTHDDKEGAKPMTMIEIRHLTALDVKLPLILKADLVRRSRLMGWETADRGSTWKFL